MTITGVNTYPNPWDFANGNKAMVSANNINKVEYSDLVEIAMGAPLGGNCFWVDENGQKTNLKDCFGGPAIWNTQGTKVAIPTWTKKFLKGTVQQISVLDIEKRELVRYKKIFDILDLRTFDENEICGYDSPLYKTKTVRFDMTNERVAERKKI